MEYDEEAVRQAWATTILELARIQVASLEQNAGNRGPLFGRGGFGTHKPMPTMGTARKSKRRRSS